MEDFIPLRTGVFLAKNSEEFVQKQMSEPKSKGKKKFRCRQWYLCYTKETRKKVNLKSRLRGGVKMADK